MWTDRTLRVGVRHGERKSPPLLLFNGIGANIELVEPFVAGAQRPRGNHFRCARRRRLARAQVALSTIDAGSAHCAAARSAGARASGRARRLWGVSAGATICVPATEALPAAGACRDVARFIDGAGKLTVLLKMVTPRRYKDPDYMNRIAGDIYGGALRSSPELVRQHLRHVRWSSDYGYYLQLIAGAGLEQPALASPSAAADARHGGDRRSDRACRQRTDPRGTHSECPFGDDRRRSFVSCHAA